MSKEPLLTSAQIFERVKELGKEISSRYDFDIIVSILTGAFIFTSDLCRAMPRQNMGIYFIKASSYGNGMESTRELKISGLDKVPIKGSRILLVDDIVDSGRTLCELVQKFKDLGAQEVKSCAFLDKADRREVKFDTDFTGFKIPNAFVVGYGLDYADEYRTFPDIWTLFEQ